MSAGFDKSQRVLRREDFLATQKSGRRLHAAHLVLVQRARGDDGPARLGLVTSRKAGTAVRRNGIRRVLREVFRLHPELFARGTDHVVIARDGCPALAFVDAHAEIRAALARRRVGGRPPPPATAGPAGTPT